MKVLYYDCFCGISGAMNLGAMIDLGVDKEYLFGELAKLQLGSEYNLSITKDLKNGITGIKVRLEQPGDLIDAPTQYRTLKDMEAILTASPLGATVKERSLAMFKELADAEARLPEKPLEEVQVHAIWSLESIIDIVGAAICFDYLKVDKIMASSVQVGGGFVTGAQGLMPVPTPVTVEMLKGIPLKFGLVPHELVTRTGAVILAVNATEFTDQQSFNIEKIGYGIGEREMAIPHVLRVYLGVAEATSDQNETGEEREIQYVLETNIDDQNPEIYSFVEEKLFQVGALDVYKTSIMMKKGRPAIELSVLFKKEQERDILDVIFRETTALGVRLVPVEKVMLQRDFRKVKTQYGEVTVKNAYYRGELVKCKPEYEQCRGIAQEYKIPIAKVYREVNKILEENEG